MPTQKNSSVDQTNAIILQELLHVEATFYPVLTVHVNIEIQPDFPWNSWTSSLLLDTSTSPLHKEKHGPHAPAKPLTLAMTFQQQDLYINKATNILIYCKIATKNYAREQVLISRIHIKQQDE